jgi:hypothetical protein
VDGIEQRIMKCYICDGNGFISVKDKNAAYFKTLLIQILTKYALKI